MFKLLLVSPNKLLTKTGIQYEGMNWASAVKLRLEYFYNGISEKENTILIKNNMNLKQKRETIKHEITEFIQEVYKGRTYPISHKYSEQNEIKPLEQVIKNILKLKNEK